MRDTYNYMKNFVSKEMMNSTPEDIARAYKLVKDDRLIAAMFCKMYPIIVKTAEKYYQLDEHQVVADSLQVVTELLESFDPEKNVKFTSMFSTCIYRRFYAALKPLTYKKRQCPTSEISGDDPAFFNGSDDSESRASLFDCIEDRESSEYSYTVELETSIEKAFGKTESRLFLLLSEGYSKSDAADILDLTMNEVNKIIRHNKSKLAEVLGA